MPLHSSTKTDQCPLIECENGSRELSSTKTFSFFTKHCNYLFEYFQQGRKKNVK